MKHQVALTITSLLSILFTTFAWTLLALGVTAIFSVIISARGLRSQLRAQPR